MSEARRSELALTEAVVCGGVQNGEMSRLNVRLFLLIIRVREF